MAVDLVGKCPVTIRPASGTGGLHILFPLPKAAFQENKAELTQRFKAVNLRKPTGQNDMVIVLITDWKRAPEQYECVRGVIREIALPMMADAICPYCQQGVCDTVAVKNGIYMHIHAHCGREDEAAERERLETSGNYFTGALGALGGALLLLALSLLLIVWTHRSFGWLYALSTGMAVLGYIKLKGPYTTAGSIVVGVCSILSFLVFLYAEALFALSELGIKISLAFFFEEFSDLTEIIFSPDYLGSNWFEILFFVIGFVLVFVSRPLSRSRLTAELDQRAALSHSLSAHAFSEQDERDEQPLL